MSNNPSPLTSDQIIALAPDAGSAKSGRELANTRKWVTLGHNDVAAWGECQGSGSKPYQTQIDLNDTAFNCSCPSRKFPCKHSLALFLMLAEQPNSFPAANNTPPEWVAKWLEGRNKRAQKAAAAAEPLDPEAEAAKAKQREASQARTAAKRESNVAAGLAEIESWLQDLVRGGLAAAQSQPYQFWEKRAARMVDAQAPGVARLIREMTSTPQSGEGWDGRLLDQVSRLHLLIEGYGRGDAVGAEQRAAIRTLVGFTQEQDDVLAQAGERDRWLVLGTHTQEEDKLRVRRNWLWGTNSKRFALLVNFAAPGQQLDTSLVAGTALDATLCYFAAAFPQRALIKERHDAPQQGLEPAGGRINNVMADFGRALSQNPWLERYPMLLDAVVLQQHGEDGWLIRDEVGYVLPVAPGFDGFWQMLAIGGGRPGTVFGEWDGRYLLPLSAWADVFVQL